MNRTQIQVPQLSRDLITACYAQQRPYREGGNLLQKVKLNDRVIVHNYGHGGAGVSLAPGSAIAAVKLAESDLKNAKSVAIIGSGIIGLFTCYELLKEHPQLKVIVYADKIPVFGEKDNNKLITSQVAPGFWLPYHYGSSDDQLHTRLSSLSLKVFYLLSKQPQYKDVMKEVQMFDITDDQFKQDYKKVLTEELRPSYQEQKIILNGKSIVECRTFTTIKIDLQPFLEIFTSELKSKGVAFINKTISKANLTELKGEVIFNCSGLGSRTLFDDTRMKGIKGHLIEFRNENPQKYNYFLRANIDKQFVNYYMHDSRIILGLTHQNVDNCKIDMSQINHLLDSHFRVLMKHGLTSPSPKL